MSLQYVTHAIFFFVKVLNLALTIYSVCQVTSAFAGDKSSAASNSTNSVPRSKIPDQKKANSPFFLVRFYQVVHNLVCFV